MNAPVNPEDRLTESLHQRADRMDGRTFAMDEVVTRAHSIRRRRRTTVAVLAAAGVAVIAIPTSIALSGHGDAAPGPVSPPSGSKSPSAEPTPSPDVRTAPDAVGRLHRGAAPAHGYLANGTLHSADGSTRALHLGPALAAFTPYRGAWLVDDGQSGQVRQVDAKGREQRSGAGASPFAVSSDGVRTAYTMGGRLYVGTSSGMANGENSVAADPGTATPIGFLSGGRLLYSEAGDSSGHPELKVLGGHQLGHGLDAIATPAATTERGDLVAGDDGSGHGLVVSAETGRKLWSSSAWSPVAFSPDGRSVAATGLPGTRDHERLGILDARTGRLVASHSLPDDGIALMGRPIFETSTRLLFVGAQRQKQGTAVLRMNGSGDIDRATDLAFPRVGTTYPFVLETGP